MANMSYNGRILSVHRKGSRCWSFNSLFASLKSEEVIKIYRFDVCLHQLLIFCSTFFKEKTRRRFLFYPRKISIENSSSILKALYEILKAVKASFFRIFYKSKYLLSIDSASSTAGGKNFIKQPKSFLRFFTKFNRQQWNLFYLVAKLSSQGASENLFKKFAVGGEQSKQTRSINKLPRS